MLRHLSFLSLLVCILSALACGDDSTGVDAGGDARAADSSGGDVDMDAATGALDTGVDTGSGEVDGGSARVPLFLAIGWGGRHIVSCDMGRTWIDDTFESTEDDWHQPYTPKSLAYHEGVFARMTGWGTTATVHTSRDGLEWTSIGLGEHAATIGYDERWVALNPGKILVSDNGASWTELEGAAGSGLNRDGAVYPGIWITGADGSVRFNRGEGWVDLLSCAGTRHTSIGVTGGFAASPDRVVSFGDGGTTCVVDRNTGEDLGAGTIGAGARGVGAYVNGEFWLANGDQLYRSPDGLSWTSEALPGGVAFEHVADSGEGTIAAVSRNGDSFYYSDDNGASWQAADAPAGNDIYRVIFGYAQPSAQCPAP